MKTNLDLRHVFGETAKFVENLIGEFTGVTHDNSADRRVFFGRFELLQNGNDKNSRFSHSRLGLADDVGTEDGLRDALVLDLRGMFKATVANGRQELRLEQKLAKPSSVHGAKGISEQASEQE